MDMAKNSINITGLAAELNLSKGTVSRILNDETAPFAAETRKRVLAVALERGYQPNPIARALATGRTGLVGLWIPDLRSYYAEVAQFVEVEVERHSYGLVIDLVRSGGWQEKPAHLAPGNVGTVDGIIAHGVSEEALQEVPLIASGKKPVVMTGTAEEPTTLDFVRVDIGLAARQAVAHLVQSGRRRIAFLASHIPQRIDGMRYQAYVSVLGEAGLPTEFIETGGEARAATRQSLRDYVGLHGCPEAIFCYNDDTAVAAYRALCDLGVRVPDDTALFGCDGIEDTEYLPTPISTIAQPYGEICRLAWQFLRQRIQEPNRPPQRAVLQPTLILRESSGG